jgi:hypothetical protein
MPEIFFLEDISGDDVNPYEAVTAASQESRRINQVRLMMDVTEEGEKPTTLALKRMSERKVKVSYASSDGAESHEEQNGATEQSS